MRMIPATGVPSQSVLILLLMFWTHCLPRLQAAGSEETRTVHTAITTTIQTATSTTTINKSGEIPSAPYLGVNLATNRSGQLMVAGVDDDSPAAKAGVQINDIISKVSGKSFADTASLRTWIQQRSPGDAVEIALRRNGKTVKTTVTLDAVSHPLKPAERRGFIGLSYGEPDDTGAVVRFVTTNSPAAKAGIKVGDLIVRVGNAPMSSTSTLNDVMTEKNPGDPLDFTLMRSGVEQRVTVTLGTAAATTDIAAPLPSIWKRSTYRLAVIGIEFPDTRLNPAIPTSAWEQSLFSTGSYTNTTNATGQRVHGSLADYYREVSCGNLTVSGRMFAPVEVGKNRIDYAGATRDSDKTKLLTEAIDKLLEREGKGALKDFDGLIFIYAGSRYPSANRGTIYWPHRASVTHGGKRWSYYICPEGGKTMASISVFCHEFGHMLGLPDLYARPENPGSEGLGVWCLMSNERGDGKPQHPSAWCKEQLGWLKPAVIDPSVPQKLVLNPVEGSTNE
ncbi:MAG TPA: M6 family metalloprotease domain-containing protein, partial [Roseimicrobium sp.]|nr:M6 family metalloprotease domain-containing protein [Roseimicrobium sp.]